MAHMWVAGETERRMVGAERRIQGMLNVIVLSTISIFQIPHKMIIGLQMRLIFLFILLNNNNFLEYLYLVRSTKFFDKFLNAI